MDDPGALRLANLLPEDHSVGERRSALDLGRQLIEGTLVAPTFQRGSFQFGLYLILTDQSPQGAFAQIQHFLALPHPKVVELWPDRSGHVAGQGPGRGGPYQQALAWTLQQRQTQGQAGMGDLLISLGDDFMLREAGAAAAAPRHHISALIDPASIVAGFQDRPDRVVVFIGKGKVGTAELRQSQLSDHRLDRAIDPAARAVERDQPGGIRSQLVLKFAQPSRAVPVHPIPEANALFGLERGKFKHSLLAEHDEFREPELLDVSLRPEASFALDLYFHPQPLAVKSVLKASLVTLH